MAKDKWARITANLEPPLSELAKARAKSLHQSVAGYVTTLIERDIAAAGAVGEGKPTEGGDVVAGSARAALEKLPVIYPKRKRGSGAEARPKGKRGAGGQS